MATCPIGNFYLLSSSVGMIWDKNYWHTRLAFILRPKILTFSASLCITRLLGRRTDKNLGQAIPDFGHWSGFGHDWTNHQCPFDSSNQENGPRWSKTVLWARVRRSDNRTGYRSTYELCPKLCRLLTCMLPTASKGKLRNIELNYRKAMSTVCWNY